MREWIDATGTKCIDTEGLSDEEINEIYEKQKQKSRDSVKQRLYGIVSPGYSTIENHTKKRCGHEKRTNTYIFR